MTMTEVTQETPILTEVLVRHAFYRHHGVIRIAVDDFTLQDLVSSTLHDVTLAEVELDEEPGSPEWVTRMVRIRRQTISNLTTARTDLQERMSHFERMAEAILAVAVEKKWCEEYDAFAEEWGLISRLKTFHVSMTVRVEARSHEDAVNIVQGCVSTSYTDGISGEPEYDAIAEDN